MSAAEARKLLGVGGVLVPPPAACDSTEAIYGRGIRYFNAWHTLRFGSAPELPLSASVVLTFTVEHLEGLKGPVAEELAASGLRRNPEKPSAVATVRSWLTALAVAQASAGFTEVISTQPVKLHLRRHARVQANRHRRVRTRPVTAEVLNRLLETCEGGSLIDLRDRALFLVAIESGGRRSSELRNLRVEHLVNHGDGYQWVMPSSKTDAGTARDFYQISGEAADALRAWLEAADITEGWVFRGFRNGRVRANQLGRTSLRSILRGRATAAGLDPMQFSPHSLRYGFIEQASARGADIWSIMRRTGHRSPSTLMHYSSRARAFC